MKTCFLCFLCFLSAFCFSQQKEEFKMVKNYYNHHRSLFNLEFKKKFDAENNSVNKETIKKDFLIFMQKMDSIENTALIGALLKVKNLEDLGNIHLEKQNKSDEESKEIFINIDKTANYPGGINTLRQEVAHLLYTQAVNSENSPVKTEVAFVVEKDGSVSNVKAKGENFTFNRQAEIALYSISEKFSPAYINGTPVRYRFRLPLTLNFE